MTQHKASTLLRFCEPEIWSGIVADDRHYAGESMQTNHTTTRYLRGSPDTLGEAGRRILREKMSRVSRKLPAQNPKVEKLKTLEVLLGGRGSGRGRDRAAGAAPREEDLARLRAVRPRGWAGGRGRAGRRGAMRAAPGPRGGARR